MTFPPCFPLPSQAFFAPVKSSGSNVSHENSVSLKPRPAPEDEECANLLLAMYKIIPKELQAKQGEHEEGDAASASSTLEEDSTLPHGDSSSFCIKSAPSHEDSNVARTVSMDCDDSVRPPVDFVELRHRTSNPMVESLFQTPVTSSSFGNTLLHRPVVITPNVGMNRTIISFSTPQVHQHLHELQQQPFHNALRTAFAAMDAPAIANTETLPKLPPLMRMKLEKRKRKNNEMNALSLREDISSPIPDLSLESLCLSENKKPPSVPSLTHKRLRRTKKLPVHTSAACSVSSASPGPSMRKHGGGKKFSWKNYPELEDFLIANRPEYLQHSAQNYTLEQKDYNNTLTARLIDYAESCGYGNLLELPQYEQDFGSFTAVRDRIRGYYKSFLQSSRRREQRRQRRLEKQRLQEQEQNQVASSAA